MRKYLIFCFCISCLVFAKAQEISPREYVQLIYDKDVNLYKGTIHDANPNPRKGHKYWFSLDNTIGSITANGVTYDSLLLRYDVYRQNLVLEYNCSPFDLRFPKSIYQKNNNVEASQTSTIDVDPAFFDEFTLGNYRFVTTKNANISFPYLQAIPSETLECYIGWRKDYFLDGVELCFSEENRYVYLKVDGKYKRLFKKSAILKTLPKPTRAEINKYCKAIKFNVKKSNVNKFYLLFSHIDKVMESYEN